MSTHILRRTMDSIDLLERVLNKSSLSTKRTGHNHILKIGDELLSKTYVDVDAMKEAAVKEALAIAERRHVRELRTALKKQHKELEDDKTKSMEKQKQYYEDLAERVAEQRDRAEEENIRQLKRLHEKDKEDVLRKQWEECELIKQQAIIEANIALEKKLAIEFNIEKKNAIDEALIEAEKMFAIRQQKIIADTTAECAARAAEEAARVAKQHAAEVQRHQHGYALLKQRYHKELNHRERVEKDFRDLQDDYKRFMDYTGGKYHSDYMMQLRNHGYRIAEKHLSVVQYEDIEQL